MFFILRRFSPLPLIAFLIFAHILLYFLFRIILFYFIEPEIMDRASIIKALYIGLKFDGRYAIFTVLPLSLALLFPVFERSLYASKSLLRRFFCILQSVIFSVFVFLHILDIGVYFYLQQRLDMTLLEFVENPAISALMVWQSYPVIWISLALFLFILSYYYFWDRVLRSQRAMPLRKKVTWKNSHFLSRDFLKELQNLFVTKESNAFSFAIFVRVSACIFMFIIGYGQISSNFFPLRWSNAYLSADNKIPLIALHPIQNLYDTMHISTVVDPILEKSVEVFPSMASRLEISAENIDAQMAKLAKMSSSELKAQKMPLDFLRTFEAKEREKPLNVVLLMMESLTTPRSSLPHGIASIDNYTGKGSLVETLGEKLGTEYDLNPTPFLAELMDEALYYPNFYANARTTARGIFSTITGVPDINFNGGTSSRNPRVVDQQVIFNEFDGYEKYYLIGGNANWANIRGILQSNIKGLNLFEESYWDAPNVDVWGVSDLALLRESITLFNESKKPFIAFIQTAGFHRPYTIPSDNEGFEMEASPSAQAIEYWGFENEAEYHSMRFSDHALRRFFDRAKKEPWFEDTVFIIFGDHGITKASKNMSYAYLHDSLQSWHTPFFIYAPKKVLAGINPALHSQMDIFPTVANMAGIAYRNTSLGRNMLQELENGLFVPKEFSQDPLNNQYVYDAKKDQSLDNRVYIGVNEGGVFFLQDKYLYIMNIDDTKKENIKLYDLTGYNGEINPMKNYEELRNLNNKNLVEDLPEIAKDMQKKSEDFYHSAKYLLQYNKKRP